VGGPARAERDVAVDGERGQAELFVADQATYGELQAGRGQHDGGGIGRVLVGRLSRGDRGTRSQQGGGGDQGDEDQATARHGLAGSKVRADR
jgi:hypothetical protein